MNDPRYPRLRGFISTFASLREVFPNFDLLTHVTPTVSACELFALFGFNPFEDGWFFLFVATAFGHDRWETVQASPEFPSQRDTVE